MKKSFFIVWPLVLAVMTIFAQPTDFPKLTGPYLGQKPPGMTPVIFAPGIVSTGKREGFLVTCPGGKELYYGEISSIEGKINTKIIRIKENIDYWNKPELAPFSSNYIDGYFAISPDGSKFFFQSNRPVDPLISRFTWNIWVMERSGNTWTEPGPLGQPINGRNHVSGPSAASDGTLYFTLMTIGGLQELYRSRYVEGRYLEPERLPNQVNSVKQQFDSYISPDESYLIFNGELKDSIGGVDLYISFRNNKDEWSRAINLGPSINSPDDESSATITPDGKYIFFGRMNGQNDLDIYWVDAGIIKKLRPKEMK